MSKSSSKSQSMELIIPFLKHKFRLLMIGNVVEVCEFEVLCFQSKWSLVSVSATQLWFKLTFACSNLTCMTKFPIQLFNIFKKYKIHKEYKSQVFSSSNNHNINYHPDQELEYYKHFTSDFYATSQVLTQLPSLEVS